MSHLCARGEQQGADGLMQVGIGLVREGFKLEVR